MINLMPTDLKQSYQYAHRNTRLIGWLIAFGVGLVGLAAIATAGVVYISQSTATYNQQNAAAEASLKQQKLGQVEKNVQGISGSFKLVIEVLSKEVLFSRLLKQLAAITPANVNLTNLDITDVQGGLDITAVTTDYNAATQLQVNLADPANKLFSKADIVSISCGTGTNASSPSTTSQAPANSHYPCTVVVRALFAANNPYLFISNSNATGSATP